MSSGYFQIALGRTYIDESQGFLESIRLFNDRRPVSVLVKKEDFDYALEKRVFDKVIVLEENGMLFSLCKNAHDKYCIFPRVSLLEYVPYREAIIIDTDVLCTYDTDSVWETFRDKGQPFNCVGNYHDESFHWNKISDINKRLGFNVNCAHGGIFYLNKNFGERDLETFFLHMLYSFINYDNLGFTRGFDSREAKKGSMTDEIMIGYAMSKMGYTLLDFSIYPIMTFEIEGYLIDEMTLPNKVQSYKWFTLYWEQFNKDKPFIMKDPIPFIHVFGQGFQKTASLTKLNKSIREYASSRNND
jgi:hypothetical protein